MRLIMAMKGKIMAERADGRVKERAGKPTWRGKPSGSLKDWPKPLKNPLMKMKMRKKMKKRMIMLK